MIDLGPAIEALTSRLRHAFRAFDRPTAAVLLLAGTIVGTAVVIGLGAVGIAMATADSCTPLVIPAPEVLRPQATDQIERLPFSFGLDENPERDAMDEPEPRQRRRHGRRG